jgi:hypothetical protein
MAYQPSMSPWDVANNPPPDVREYYGEISINVWWCMLVSGQGKVPYDEKTLDPKTGKEPRRYTAIDLTVTPIGQDYDMSRTMIAEFGEWKDVTWPSLRALGVMDVSTLIGKFGKIEMVPTGRKYTNQNGEEKEASAMKFLAIYDDYQQCLAAANGALPQSQQTQPAMPSNGSNVNQATTNTDRETALKFAELVYVKNAVKGANGDLDKAREALAPILAGQKLIAKYFTVDSPEIVDLLIKEMARFRS